MMGRGTDREGQGHASDSDRRDFGTVGEADDGARKESSERLDDNTLRMRGSARCGREEMEEGGEQGEKEGRKEGRKRTNLSDTEQTEHLGRPVTEGSGEVTRRVLLLVEERNVHTEDLGEGTETKLGGETLGGGAVHPRLNDDEDGRDCGKRKLSMRPERGGKKETNRWRR